MARITPKTKAWEVQDVMNATREGAKWERRNSLWLLLLRARNLFIKETLSSAGMTANVLRHLVEIQRYRQISRLEEAFKLSFFEYSRDSDWMELAVGKTDEWIRLDGMATWHVKFALAALEKDDDKEQAATNRLPFDAVKDAVQSNMPLEL